MAEAAASREPGPRVHVVAALSLSVLDAVENCPTDRPQRLEWLEDEANLATVVEWVVEHRPDTPSSELTPLPAILDRAESDSTLVLHLLVDSDDPLHGPVAEVLRRVAAQLPETTGRVEVVEVCVAAGFTSLEGAGAASTSVPEALAPLVAEGAGVWVNATSSVRAVSIQAVALAGVAGWNVFIIPDRSKQEIHVLDLRAIGPDRASVMAVLDDDDLSQVLDRLDDDDPDVGSAVGAVSGGPGAGLGSSLRAYYETLIAGMPDRPAHPATAAVLARHARSARIGAKEAKKSGELSGALASCVQRWVDQRLWSLNLIPEIVVHDDRHVERVDGFLALLVAPLLHAGRLAPEQVAAMSAAAWLHDWGHVGSRLGSGYVSHPIAVRYLHGLLSRQLIADAPSTHGLGQLGDSVPDLVGVLCAHHQRWCSCSDAQINLQGKQSEVLRLYTDQPEVLAPTLHDEADRIGRDPQELELMVSLLRIADACDVGAHRAPAHGRGRREFLLNCARRELDRTAAHLHQLAGGTNLQRDVVEWVEDLRRTVEDLWSDAQQDQQLQLPETPDLEDASPAIVAAVRLSRDYLQVLADRSHDDLHRSIRLVRFRIDLGPDAVNVVPQVWAAPDAVSEPEQLPMLDMMNEALRNELDECSTSAGTVRKTIEAAGLRIGEAVVVTSTG